MAAAADEDAPLMAASERARRKILVAVDESDESISALSWAVDNLILPCPLHSSSSSSSSGKCSDVIVLLHVQNHPQFLVGPILGPGYPPAGFYITPEILDSVRKHQDDISKQVLLRAKTICDEKHLDAETMVSLGDPRDAICEAVEKLHPNFLIIGSHGYGAIKRAFLGSVSDYCAHNAKCPVVIVKNP